MNVIVVLWQISLFLFLGQKSYICCTVRTTELYSQFINGLAQNGLQLHEHYLEQKNVWYYDKYADIVVVEIWKEKEN